MVDRRSVSKQRMQQDKLRAQLNIMYASLSMQALVSLLVIGFCCRQLSRATETEATKAVYVSILTGTVAYWYPSPATGYLQHLSDTETASASVRRRRRHTDPSGTNETEDEQRLN
jgi:hypothetical protein